MTRASRIPWLGPLDAFPDPRTQADPDPEVPGLLAVSEHLEAQQLARAYRQGIFPWYSENQPVLWWSPNPRMVLHPKEFHVSESFQKTLRQVMKDESSEIRVDDDFTAVIQACATTSRKGQDGTWITHEIVNAYTTLFENKLAHSIALYKNEEIQGGLYCVAMGQMVFGESMFSRSSDSSKIALAALCAWCYDLGVDLIDCQQETPHLRSLGSRPIDRTAFLDHLAKATVTTTNPHWQFNKAVLQRWL